MGGTRRKPVSYCDHSPTLAMRTRDSAALCFDAKFMADAYTISNEFGGLPAAALRGGFRCRCAIHFTLQEADAEPVVLMPRIVASSQLPYKGIRNTDKRRALAVLLLCVEGSIQACDRECPQSVTTHQPSF